jgi:formylglycine-generating enzyme required for sulfatase activity
MFLSLFGIVLLSISAPAVPWMTAPQTATTNSVATNSPANPGTNTVPLKELMASNNIVTNTVGTVLIKLSPTLWAGVYEVTQKEYQGVAGKNPSAFSGDDHPVDTVSWNDAVNFCRQLTITEKDQLPDGFTYSLPTEKQWEMLVAGASLKDAVMKLNGDHSSTAPVGSLGANGLGLYDTRGNVMEWCLDSANPMVHVLRGGAWDTAVEPSSRLEFRNYVQTPDEKKNDYGFRIVLEAVTP